MGGVFGLLLTLACAAHANMVQGRPPVVSGGGVIGNCTGADLTVPSLAQSAGFTTLIACWDFTKMSNADFTNGNITCHPNNGAANFQLYAGWDAFFKDPIGGWKGCGTPGTSNAYFDTDNGTTGMFVRHYSNQNVGCTPTNGVGCTIALSTSLGRLSSDGPGVFFPINGYFEWTARVNVYNPSVSTAANYIFWNYGRSTNDPFIERDMAECSGYTNAGCDYDTIAMAGSIYSGDPHVDNVFDISQYHTWVYQSIGNKSNSTMNVSGYVDGTLWMDNGFGGHQPPISQSLTAGQVGPPGEHSGYYVAWNCPPCGPTGGDEVVDAAHIVKKVRIFSCADWRTTACFPGD